MSHEQPRRRRPLTMPTAADTVAFGKRLAAILRAGDLLILTGPLGAGKTALTQGIGAGLEVAGRITSPTFVIARTHRPGPAGLPLVHVDAYRLEHLDELDDLDLDTELAASVTVVEWGAGLAERLAEAHLEIRIARHADETREIELIGRGGDWSERLGALAAAIEETSEDPAAARAETPPATGAAAPLRTRAEVGAASSPAPGGSRRSPSPKPREQTPA